MGSTTIRGMWTKRSGRNTKCKLEEDFLGYGLEFLLTFPFLLTATGRRFPSSSFTRIPCGSTLARKSPRCLISNASPLHQISCPTSPYVWKSMFVIARPSGGGSRRIAMEVSASECLEFGEQRQR